jgi:hypothetical protein
MISMVVYYSRKQLDPIVRYLILVTSVSVVLLLYDVIYAKEKEICFRVVYVQEIERMKTKFVIVSRVYKR